VRPSVPPAAEAEEQIDQLLAVGVGENPRESLSGAVLVERPQLSAARMGGNP
jgi:hypothetical protein